MKCADTQSLNLHYNYDKNKKNTSVIKMDCKDSNIKKYQCDSFIKNVFDNKKQMNDIIDKVKMSDFKQRLQLEDEKNKCIIDIKDTCKKYKDQLAPNMGISNELDYILSGNVEKVTSTMDFNEVSKHISNLEYSLIHGSRGALEEYYRNRKDKDQTFAQYMNDNSAMDIEKVMSSEDVSEETKGQLGLLEGLKKQYEYLFDIIDRIKKFKEESTEGLKKLQENMEKCLAETKNQGIMENKLEYDNGNIKKNR
jgi:hypothetical protein